MVAEGIGVSPGALHAELKFHCGLIRNIMLTQAAGTVVELKSTAFAAMPEDEFSEFVTMAIEVAFERYLPGVKRREVLARVEEMVGALA